ncbi:DnaA regulatory inactivator Hda [Pollutimonas thiosulfatoxidans]|uniref:DnaA regulatory inactivator Hda n=1 Tax=Pollutimonas thiosulfatoxidans TaxID=2028345 RepID=A0A410GCK8_9BURK|nr:DnaA regulatory inactivator Hda [Pollutimonas thiosulfatoxidans]MBF6617025.1 DnaA regulatory inactivator Hda [Candidimonas sp.]NYT44416.1 DnaA regulatory inactivator Hda [Alcaligenaceae bacterium]QAA94042.1 DnaA regulatory inactivator Hda [Pollutimonas thiosulfatoxidans]
MTQQLILDVLPYPPPTLDNFVSGDNAAAVDALRHCEPGRAIYLWGPDGAGRSHLLKALAGLPDAYYFGPDGLPSELKSIAAADSQPYRLIAIDDVQRLSPDGQAALFSLYNRWRELASAPAAFALIVAGDRAPMAMPLREDLRTRLGWDLVFRLQMLSDADRAQALRRQASDRGLQLSPEVINWVLTHYARDMSHLSALVDALDRYSLEKHRAITLPLLKELLASGRPDNESDTL